MNRSTNQAQDANGTNVSPSGRQPPRFGAGVDAREAGRKGGKASGVARRLRPLRELEAGIVESRNGAAKWKLLEARRRELAAVERERIKQDEIVCRLMDEEDAQRKVLAELAEEEARLHRVVETGEGLVGLLRVAHGRGLLEDALRELDLFEEVPDGAVAAEA